MSSGLVSVIVPVYNIKDEIRRCVDSLLIQTYEDIEIILIDDGSTDGSAAICDEMSELHSQVNVIHQNNMGISATRNTGVASASGELISFVDGDDYVAKDFIEFLVGLLSSTQADIAQCGHYIQYSSERRATKDTDQGLRIIGPKEALKSLCYNQIYDVTLWNKIYRRDIFKNIEFPVGERYEDTAVSYLLAERCKKIAIQMIPKYFYVQRYSSIANGLQFTEAKYQFIEVGDQMADYISRNYPDLERASEAKRCFVRLSTLSQIVNTHHRDINQVKRIRGEVLSNALPMLTDSNVGIRDKFGIVALACGFQTYRLIWSFYYRIKRRA
ncbi:glycosyltransferase [Lacticaseibacillus paracasei]|uniref:glycosyltransferase family 2 protein n=1 Tax=Lacticaseibacillus paracasei TaxID=1597 RepID=UPI0027383E92|nr:glycosyltransferase [Lacticaseibacillus paracasei]MDP4467181.1 glycosyltransferase [Lacticaseibacillus paracasei]